MVVVISWYCIN